jgi:hypothetical protein
MHGLIHPIFEVTDEDAWIPVSGDARDDLAVHLPFPAVVRGRDADDHAFEEESTVESLSPTRLSLTLSRPVIAGADLQVVVRLSLAGQNQIPALQVALEGTITRTEWLGASRWRLEMQFRCHRFIYLADQEPDET